MSTPVVIQEGSEFKLRHNCYGVYRTDKLPRQPVGTNTFKCKRCGAVMRFDAS